MGSFNCAISPRVASSKSCLSFIVMAWRTAALARSVLVVAPLDSVPCWAIAGVPANAIAASSIVAIARAFSILGLLNLGCRQRAAGLAASSWETALRAMAMPGPGCSLIRRDVGRHGLAPGIWAPGQFCARLSQVGALT